MKIQLVLAFTLAAALAGCKSPTSDLSHGPTQESSVKSSSPSQVYAAISGALSDRWVCSRASGNCRSNSPQTASCASLEVMAKRGVTA